MYISVPCIVLTGCWRTRWVTDEGLEFTVCFPIAAYWHPIEVGDWDNRRGVGQWFSKDMLFGSTTSLVVGHGGNVSATAFFNYVFYLFSRRPQIKDVADGISCRSDLKGSCLVTRAINAVDLRNCKINWLRRVQ
jgi:hypothetical protein